MSKNKNCYYCERPLQLPFEYVSHGQRPTKDHIIPMSKKGNGLSINLVDCCHTCNGMKSNLMPVDFLLKLEGYVVSGDKWGHYNTDRLALVYKNVQKVIVERVSKYGNKLYKQPGQTTSKKEKKIKQESLIAEHLRKKSADVKLSVNTNTPIRVINRLANKHENELRKAADEGVYPHCESAEEFLERRKREAKEYDKKIFDQQRLDIIQKWVAEPEPNFHFAE